MKKLTLMASALVEKELQTLQDEKESVWKRVQILEQEVEQERIKREERSKKLMDEIKQVEGLVLDGCSKKWSSKVSVA